MIYVSNAGYLTVINSSVTYVKTMIYVSNAGYLTVINSSVTYVKVMIYVSNLNIDLANKIHNY